MIYTTGIFTELSNRKHEANKKGKDLIGLSVRSPDLPLPPFVVDALVQHAKDINKYGYTLKGTPEFNDAVCHIYKHIGRDKSYVREKLYSLEQ
ncbi:hypothetical protein ACN6MY_11710 [Peribacillus sp. B-H-3]|uniref:hypothetical protein n=1 Tax=Peribacillus sp. B-H-3 TaxID=3400420 RepID=UPI003B025814